MWETLARYLNFDFIDKQTQQKIDPTKSNRPLSPSLTHRSLAASVDEPMSLEAEEKALSRSINIWIHFKWEYYGKIIKVTKQNSHSKKKGFCLCGRFCRFVRKHFSPMHHSGWLQCWNGSPCAAQRTALSSPLVRQQAVVKHTQVEGTCPSRGQPVSCFMKSLLLLLKVIANGVFPGYGRPRLNKTSRCIKWWGFPRKTTQCTGTSFLFLLDWGTERHHR